MSTHHTYQDDGIFVRSAWTPSCKDLQENATEASKQTITTEEKTGVGAVHNIEKLKQDSVVHDLENLTRADRSLGGPSRNSQMGGSCVQRNERVSKYQFRDAGSGDELDEDEIDFDLAEFNESVKRLRALAAALDREINTIKNPTLPSQVKYSKDEISRRLKRIE
ncbi:unnamed protein product [Rhizoctonia solani]|uniref:Uncharacterized protein n=1 Tax=Rhizoctonia solani TaxID=456999 RepID=A0A8H2XUK8_9AGAM|nr:unnamed protein product [Rhizoctonia solani]